MVVVAEGCGRAAFFLLEDAVEVTDVVEAATVANLCNAGVGIHKLAGSIAETNVNDIVADSLACTRAKETGEGSWGHSCYIGKGLQTYLALEVLVDVLLDSTHATALGRILHVGKRLAGQQVIIVLKGELVEYLEQGEHPVEAGLSRSDVRYLAVQLHDSRQLEGNTSLGILEEGAQARELVLLKELLTEQIGRELNGNLMDGMALAVVLVPHMFQSASDEHQVILTQNLDAVANNTAGSIAMLHEVQFHLLVFVERISERILVTVEHQEAILLAQWRNLCYNFVCHRI